jgi:hypothetical protein
MNTLALAALRPPRFDALNVRRVAPRPPPRTLKEPPMSWKSRALTLACALGGAPLALAQAPAPSAAPSPCASAEARQFDFWVGEWDVYVRGALGGRNVITREHGGCALVERWTSLRGPNTGTSVNFYDPARRGWHQTWAGSGGSFLLLDGGWDGERMILEGDSRQGNDTVGNRISWTPLPGGHVRQRWETRQGNGEWTVAFEGIYVPKGGPAPAATPPSVRP